MSFGELVLDYPSINGMPNERENAEVFEEFRGQYGKKGNFTGHVWNVGDKTYHVDCYAVKDVNETPFFNTPKSGMNYLYVIRYPENIDSTLIDSTLFSLEKNNYIYYYVVYLLLEKEINNVKSRYTLKDLCKIGAEKVTQERW